MESLEERLRKSQGEDLLRRTKEHAKELVLTVTSIFLIGTTGLYYLNYRNVKKENQRREEYQEILLDSLCSIQEKYKNLKDAYRYIMYKMYQQKEDIGIVPYEILFQVNDTFPDILVLVPHKKGTGLLYLFVMDERRIKDESLHDCQDEEHKTKMIRLITINENSDDNMRRSLLYNSIDYLINEAKRFYNED
jgi:hypothetical protein